VSETMMMEFEGVEVINEFGFDPIEPGIYEARVDSAEFKFAKSGDNSPMVVLNWKIESGPYKGRKINYNNVVFNPKPRTTALVKGILIALGLKIPAKPVSPEALAKAFARDSVGKLARITVVDSAPNKEGRVYPEVKAIYPAEIPGAGVSATSDSGEEDLPQL